MRLFKLYLSCSLLEKKSSLVTQFVNVYNQFHFLDLISLLCPVQPRLQVLNFCSSSIAPPIALPVSRGFLPECHALSQFNATWKVPPAEATFSVESIQTIAYMPRLALPCSLHIAWCRMGSEACVTSEGTEMGLCDRVLLCLLFQKQAYKL